MLFYEYFAAFQEPVAVADLAQSVLEACRVTTDHPEPVVLLLPAFGEADESAAHDGLSAEDAREAGAGIQARNRGDPC